MIHRYYSAVRLLGNVRARRTAFAFSRRSDDQLLFRHFRGLPVLVHGISRRAWGLRLRRADRQLAILLPVMLPSAVADCVGALIANFRSSIPSPSVPLFTLHRTLHSVQRKTRGRVDRYSFLVRLFHPLSHAGFIPAPQPLFLNLDDQLGVLQLLRQAGICGLQLPILLHQWTDNYLRATLLGRKSVKLSLLALLSPFGQGRV